MPEPLHEMARAVRQHQRWQGIVGEQMSIYRADPLVHLIGRRHARQGEVQPARQPFLHEPLHEHERGLGLSRAGDVFQEKQLRPGFQRHAGRIVLQRRRFAQIIEKPRRSGPGTRRLRLQASLADGGLRARQGGVSPIGRQILRFLAIGKDGLIGPQPIGKHRQAGQTPCVLPQHFQLLPAGLRNIGRRPARRQRLGVGRGRFSVLVEEVVLDVQAGQPIAAGFMRRFAVVPHRRFHPGRPEISFGIRQNVGKRLGGKIVPPQDPAQGIVPILVGHAGIVLHEIRRQARRPALEASGKLAHVVQRQKEHRQGIHHGQRPPKRLCKPRQGKLRQLEQLPSACGHIQAVKGQEMIAIQTRLDRRRLSPIGKIRSADCHRFMRFVEHDEHAQRHCRFALPLNYGFLIQKVKFPTIRPAPLPDLEALTFGLLRCA
nr:hypothetical protein [Achromobacter sp. DMS1]